MSDHDTWNEFTAYATARGIVAENPALLTAVVRGATQGSADAMQKLKEDLAWANMSVTAALAMATKRITPETRELLEKCLVKRFESYAGNNSQFEREFLAESKKRETPEPTPPQPDNDGWIKWEGGECPVSDGTIVDVQYRDRSRNAGEVASSSSDAEGRACGAFWHNDDSRADIVAYRIVSEAGATK